MATRVYSKEIKTRLSTFHIEAEMEIVIHQKPHLAARHCKHMQNHLASGKKWLLLTPTHHFDFFVCKILLFISLTLSIYIYLNR